MQSRNTTYSTADLTDFSSVFMNAITADEMTARQIQDDEISTYALKDFAHKNAVNENKNLSSIITRIRDEGSAAPPTKKTDSWYRKNSQDRAAAAAVKARSAQTHLPEQARVEANLAAKKRVSDYSMTTEVPVFQRAENIAEARMRGQWQPFVLSLALALTVVMGFNLYQLHDQAGTMMLTLSSYEEQINDLSADRVVSSDALNSVSSLKQELSGLKQELEVIRSGYEDVDSRLTLNSVNDVEPQQQIATVKKNVSELESDLASTRNEMTAIRAVLNEVKGALVNKQQEPPAIVRSSGWVVNLASLSSKEQAQLGVEMLEDSGAKPVIQETVVNGTTVYRLSVEGFATRDAALQFINKARRQYGFDGGWVRQG